MGGTHTPIALVPLAASAYGRSQYFPQPLVIDLTVPVSRLAGNEPSDAS